MATIVPRLSAKTDKQTGKVEIIIRLYHGKVIDHNAKTGIFINPAKYWDDKKKEIKVTDRIVTDENEYHTEAKKRLGALTSHIETEFLKVDRKAIPSDWLKATVDRYNHPDKYNKAQEETKLSFFDVFDSFLDKRKLSDVREKNFLVLKRALQRYEMFVSVNEKRNFILDLATINADVIEDFESFLRNEHTLYNEYPELYKRFPAITGSQRKTHKPQPRGHNTICALFNKLRAFFNWCNEQELTTNKPFAKYEGCTTEKYSRPVFITLDERNQIADFNLSENPNLAVQRDIFIFQCLIGCRVSDLLQMTKANIIGGAIEYIPRKTKDERPQVVRVPLNDRAKELVNKYDGMDEAGRLFPFISSQNYNYAIKEIFKACKIDRMVTVLNPTTMKEEKRPIHEIASSHMARRTFIGNIYKQVADPNLVGSLSGHKEGSKAFARYRDIDDDMKKDLVKLIN